MADGFTRDKFAWLDRIAGDARVSDRAFRVAYVIAAQFLNRKSGEAWPSQGTLAAACGTNDRRVRDAIRDLVDNGHLTSRRGGRLSGGGGSPNHYEPVFDRTAPSDQKDASIGHRRPNERLSTGQSELFDRTNPVISTGRQRPTNPLKEPTEEPSDRYALAGDDGFDAFWQAYPLKKGKGGARSVYASVLRAKRATADELLDGARRYADERRDQPPRYTRHATRWLREESWTDEPAIDASTRPQWADGLRQFTEQGDPE
jgi:hypothetical protein